MPTGKAPVYAADMLPNYSTDVDYAIASILEMEQLNFTWNEFDSRWANFLSASVKDFPNISPHSLVRLESFLKTQQLREECLVVESILVGVIPSSDESLNSLGLAYQQTGRYEKAIEYHSKAAQIALGVADKRGYDVRHVVRADAASYLHQKAVCERRVGLFADAFVSLLQSIQLFRGFGWSDYNRERAAKLMKQLQGDMNIESEINFE